MGRRAREKYEPALPKVERVELSEKNTKLRIILTIVFLIIGGICLGYGISQLFAPAEGWTTVTLDSISGCSDEFSLVYELGAGTIGARIENDELTSLYSQLCVTAANDFNSVEEIDGVANIRTVNLCTNVPVTVDDILYDAFVKIQDSGSRAIYMGPIYSFYKGIFYCYEDYQAEEYDPYRNENTAELYSKIATFARDTDSVNLELLGDNTVILHVSEEYAAFMEENEFDTYIDFSWMKNAFIIDYLADNLIENGYTRGALTSYDGFVRCLDDRTEYSYSLNIRDRMSGTTNTVATMSYSGCIAAVSLRDYPVNDLDDFRFYVYENNETRTSYIDIADGRDRVAIHDFTAYSNTISCGELLLEVLPIYVGSEFDSEAVTTMTGNGIEAVYCENGCVICTDREIKLSNLMEGYITDYIK